jgi:transposase
LSSSLIALCPSCPTPDEDDGHRCRVYPSSVTDAQWAILEPLLPPPGNVAGRGGRPEKHCRRMVLDAIFYVVRGGIAWRQLPVEFPPAMTVYAIFARWVRAGAWLRIHDALRDRLRVTDGRAPGRRRRSSTPSRCRARTPCDYETRPDHHEAMVHVVTIMTLSRRLARTT